MKRTSVLLICIVLLVATVLGLRWFFRGQPELAKSTTHETVAPTPVAVPDRYERGFPRLTAVSPAPVAHPGDRSPLADALHAPEHTGIEDLAIVLNLFARYREMFGGLPVGENNAQIVNALTGNNPQRLALLPRSHPAINSGGELTDRWGTPLFFHLISRDALEIRSGGPDKILWSEDDLLTQSPSLREGR